MQLSLFADKAATPSKRKSLINRQELNSAQFEAATTIDGPILVIAGAGSGKTRTLVYRTAYLVENGISPDKILLLTFTRKAAQEMVGRACSLIDDSCLQVMGGTFHAIASMLLRRYGHHIGYSPNFTIIDQSDAEGIINILKSSLNFSGVDKKFPSKRVIINIFSSSVNKAIPLTDMISDRYSHFQEFENELRILQGHYRTFKLEHGLMDYDDLLVNLRNVMAEQPQVQLEISERFHYLMVDEYQDTNHIQADIVRLMAGEHKNVMAVGDDSQSIYSFRGADFHNIMEFPTVFKETVLIRLEENYRSTQPILSMTNAIIARAAQKYNKKLFSNISGNLKPIIHGARSDADQARYVINKIMELHKEGVEYHEIAVLFRSGFHSYKLELELANNHITFDKRGGQKLTETAHIKDVISHLRVVTNVADNLSWNRILLLLDKVGPKTAQKIVAAIKKGDDPLVSLAKYPAGQTWKAGYDRLLQLLNAIRSSAMLTPVEQFDQVMEYYRPIFERVYHDDYPTRAKDLDQLQAVLAGYTDLQSFIDDAALDPPTPGQGEDDFSGPQPLILSTVHSAKGLEWEAVFVINLVEGKFPSAMARLPEEIEEERRLLYVAATRAKRHLFMTYPRETMSQKRYTEPAIISRFLEELPPELTRSAGHFSSFNIPKTPSFISRPKKKSTEVLSGKSGNSVVVGDTIRHSFFGEGKVEKSVGPKTVQIFFPRHGLKTINLDYAKIEVIS